MHQQVLAVALYSSWSLRGSFSAAIFVIASLTDFVDGYALQQHHHS